MAGLGFPQTASAAQSQQTIAPQLSQRPTVDQSMTVPMAQYSPGYTSMGGLSSLPQMNPTVQALFNTDANSPTAGRWMGTPQAIPGRIMGQTPAQSPVGVAPNSMPASASGTTQPTTMTDAMDMSSGYARGGIVSLLGY